MSAIANGNAVAIQGIAVSVTAPSNNFVLAYNSGTGLLTWVAQTGGGGSVPTGTGFRHVTAGAEDAAAVAVNLATSDVTGTLPLSKQASPTGTGFYHVTSGSPDAASRAVNLASGDVTGVLPTANQAVQTLSGSLAGTTAAATVSAIDGVAGNCAVTANLTFSAGLVLPSISQSPKTSDVAPNDLVISAQSPWASAVTNKNSGNIILGTLPPVAGGTAGTIQLSLGGGSAAIQFAADTVQGAAGAIVIGSSPADAGIVRLPYNATAQLIIARRNAANTGNVKLLQSTTGNIFIFGDAAGAQATTFTSGAGDCFIQTGQGGGAPSMQLAYASGNIFMSANAIQLSSAISGGTGIYVEPVWNGAAKIRFSPTTTSSLIRIDDVTTNSATGTTLTIQGQNATGTTATGGDLALSPGTGTTSNGKINFSNVITGTTVGAAGAGSALPATPAGYMNIKINGTAQRIPYYA